MLKYLLTGLLLALSIGAARAEDGTIGIADMDCGPQFIPGQGYIWEYGSADYLEKRELLEGAHFTPEVERLQSGKTSGTPGPDISYTLVHVPNHPRALDALSRLAIREKTNKPIGARWTVECYFQRAIRFTPKDGRVHMIYGAHLQRTGHTRQAIEQMLLAEELLPDDANIQYNLGLLYFETKDWDKSVAYAKKAYAGGFPLEGLKKKLIGAKRWVD